MLKSAGWLSDPQRTLVHLLTGKVWQVFHNIHTMYTFTLNNIMVQNHVSINIIQNSTIRIYTSYIKFNTLVFLTFSLGYAFCIPFAPLLFQDWLTLPEPYPCLGMCISAHGSGIPQVQVSKNTFVHLFELHDYYLYTIINIKLYTCYQFCLTHVKHKIIMYHNLLYLLG